MRSDDRYLHLLGPLEEGFEPMPDAPLDIDLVAVDAELGAAGRQAGRALHGRTQPTRYYSMELRARLLSRFETPAATPPAGEAGSPRPATPR